jgi:hypothetical protein
MVCLLTALSKSQSIRTCLIGPLDSIGRLYAQTMISQRGVAHLARLLEGPSAKPPGLFDIRAATDLPPGILEHDEVFFGPAQAAATGPVEPGDVPVARLQAHFVGLP